MKIQIILLAILLQVSVFSQTDYETENYLISHPENWDLDLSGMMGSSFLIFSPIESSTDNFRENVNLMIQDLSGYNLDLKQYVDISVKQIPQFLTNGEIISNSEEKSGGISFQKLIYKGKQGIYDLQFLQYVWLRDEKAYILTLSTEESKFESYRERGEEILNSFELKN